MPTNITESDAWTTPLQVPNDTEPANQASLLEFAQGLANRSKHMRKGIPGIAATIDWEIQLVSSDPTNWSASLLGGPLSQITTAASENWIPLALPRFGGKIVAAHALLDGRSAGGGAHAGLPASMPQIDLAYFDVTVGNTDYAGGSVGSQVDTSGTIAAYDKIHTIDLTGLTETIDPNRLYLFGLQSESGANALANSLTVFKLWLTIEPS